MQQDKINFKAARAINDARAAISTIERRLAADTDRMISDGPGLNWAGVGDLQHIANVLTQLAHQIAPAAAPEPDYICPTCRAGWTKADLLAEADDDEDLVIEWTSFHQCPNCAPFRP